MKPTRYRPSQCLLLIGMCSLLPIAVVGSSTENQLWSSVLATKQIGTGFNLSLEQQLRLRDQSPVFERTFTEFGLSYSLPDRIGVTGFYRQIFYAEQTEYWLGASTQIQSVFGIAGHSVRLRLQYQKKQERDPVYHLRYRSTLSIPSSRKDLNYYLQAEPWLRLAANSYHDRIRLTAGLKYRLRPHTIGESFVQLQLDQNDLNWQITRMLGLRIRLSL
jgi:hypothetical protein